MHAHTIFRLLTQAHVSVVQSRLYLGATLSSTPVKLKLQAAVAQHAGAGERASSSRNPFCF